MECVRFLHSLYEKVRFNKKKSFKGLWEGTKNVFLVNMPENTNKSRKHKIATKKKSIK